MYLESSYTKLPGNINTELLGKIKIRCTGCSKSLFIVKRLVCLYSQRLRCPWSPLSGDGRYLLLFCQTFRLTIFLYDAHLGFSSSVPGSSHGDTSGMKVVARVSLPNDSSGEQYETRQSRAPNPVWDQVMQTPCVDDLSVFSGFILNSLNWFPSRVIDRTMVTG